MIVPAGSGWQVVLADLSLILFMTTAAAIDSDPPPPPPPASQAALPALPALAQPVAVWRDGPGAPPLADWLAAQSADPHLRLTIVAAPESAPEALALAAAASRTARVLIEPGTGTPFAALTYDQAQPQKDKP